MHDIELKPKGHIHFSYHTGGRKHKGLWISPLSFPLQDMCPLCPALAQETLRYSPCACLPPQHYLQLLAEFPYAYLSHYLPVPLKHSHTHCLLSKRQFLARVHKTQPATHHRYTQMTKWLRTAAFSSVKTLSEISMTFLVLVISSVFQLPFYKMETSVIIFSDLLSVSFFITVLHVTPLIYITTSE